MSNDASGGTSADFMAGIPWPVWLIFGLLALVLLAHLHRQSRDKVYRLVMAQPYVVVALVIIATGYFVMQFPKLHWETNSRVFFPKDHPAIIYNNEIEKIFGVKEPVIIGIVNEEKGIYNPQTLARIKRITDQLFSMPGVIADRRVDIASLTTATFFTGTESAIETRPLMDDVPQTEEEIEALKRRVEANADLFVGNIVSADGKAAMIRAKIKEDIAVRYQTYFTIKEGIFPREHGVQKSWSGNQWSGGGDWNQGTQGDDKPADDKAASPGGFDEFKDDFALAGEESIDVPVTDAQGDAAAPQQPVGRAPGAKQGDDWQGGQGAWPKQQQGQGKQWPSQGWQNAEEAKDSISARENGDQFYLAGRPVIEVLYGLQSQEDLKLMTPLLLLALVVALFIIFRTGFGVLLPIAVMVLSITWCLGTMAALHIPLYTISSMLPVILLAIGIGSAVHILGHYYHITLADPHRKSKDIVSQLMHEMAMPLVATSVTTAAGFLSLTLAEMPPLQIFGLFTALGILYVWLLTITLIPASLSMVKPKVGAYLERRRNLRVHNEEGPISRYTVKSGNWAFRNHKALLGVIAGISAGALGAGSLLYVDSSWIGDFRSDSKIVEANQLLNEKFAGTVFLNVIVDARENNGMKNPLLLKKMQSLQEKVEQIPAVGDSLSVVDYLKSMNKAFNAGDEQYKVLPESRGAIAEFLFLSSISGRPELLDEVVDDHYRHANMTFMIKTDRIQELKTIIDDVKGYVDQEFGDLKADVNTAGMANNSYVWSDLLIRSQLAAIIVSKLAVFILAALLLRSVLAGLLVVLPVTVTTLWVAGGAGLLGVPLDVSTTLAAGIAIGVGVDYAIHFLFRYMREFREHNDVATAIAMTLRRAGRTIVLNALVVSAGFMVLFASQFPPNAKTGYFVSSYMVLSCVVALLLLPAMLRVIKARFIQARASSTDGMVVEEKNKTSELMAGNEAV